MNRRIAQISSVLALVCAAACGDQSAPPIAVIPDPPPAPPSAIPSARTAPVEGSVLALYEVDDTIDPFQHMMYGRSPAPEGVEPTAEQVGGEVHAYLVVPYAVGAPTRIEHVGKEVASLLPPGRTLAWGLESMLDDEGAYKPSRYRSYVLGARILTEKQVANASAESAEFGPHVKIELDDVGAKALANGTRRLVERRMAVLAFGEIISVPRVMSELSGGSLVISMERSGGMAAAEKLVAALQRGR